MELPDVILQLPGWIERFPADSALLYPTTEERMQLAIMLAQQNIEHETGGPFGAGIFEIKSGIRQRRMTTFILHFDFCM